MSCLKGLVEDASVFALALVSSGCAAVFLRIASGDPLQVGVGPQRVQEPEDLEVVVPGQGEPDSATHQDAGELMTRG